MERDKKQVSLQGVGFTERRNRPDCGNSRDGQEIGRNGNHDKQD